jgi:chemotaxis protein MotB
MAEEKSPSLKSSGMENIMAKRKKNKHGEEEGGEAWLLPYSDLMTLLLAVFIVLFAVSKIDETKAKELADAFGNEMMSGGAGIFNGGEYAPDGSGNLQEETSKIQIEPESTGESEIATTVDTSNMNDAQIKEYLGEVEYDNLNEVKGQVDGAFASENLQDFVTTKIDPRGLVVSLSNSMIFNSGSADVLENYKNVLLKLGVTLKSLNNYIRVEGHTDNIPINTEKFPSNWELSTARATSVLRFLVESCGVSPVQVLAVGYGEYKPIADNTTAEGRAKNRRIDLIILSEKYDTLEN